MNKLETMKKMELTMFYTPAVELPWVVYNDLQNNLYLVRSCVCIIIVILYIVYWKKEKSRN